MAIKTGNKHGMNWITPHKRLAIYLRDGLACCYCGASVEEGHQLTLDHLKPRCKGGGNGEGNLVTACMRCNAARGNRSWRKFAGATAGYLNHGITGQQVVNHVLSCVRRKLNVAAAKDLIALRGGFTAALYGR
jgi:hypothetical protein